MASPEASPVTADEDSIPRLAAITTAAAANGGRKFGIAVSEPRPRESQTDPCVGVVHLFDILDGDHLPVVESILLRYGPSAVLLPKDFPSSEFLLCSAHAQPSFEQSKVGISMSVIIFWGGSVLLWA